MNKTKHITQEGGGMNENADGVEVVAAPGVPPEVVEAAKRHLGVLAAETQQENRNA